LSGDLGQPTKEMEGRLGKITDYAENHPENDLKPFRFIVGKNKEVEVIFEDGTRLSDFLPADVVIRNWPGIKDDAYVSVVRDPKNSEKTICIVKIDTEWIRMAGRLGISVLSHELGHSFYLSKENKQSECILRRKREEQGDCVYPRVPKSVRDVEKYINNKLRSLNEVLEDEVEAGNYGLAIASLFGLDDISFMDNQNSIIENYLITRTVTSHFTNFQTDIVTYISRYKKNSNNDFISEEKFSVFDVFFQENVSLSFDELIQYLKSVEERAKDIESKRR